MHELHGRASYFFATPKDLEPGLKRIEKEQALIYIHDPTEGYETKNIPIYHSAFGIPDWGVIRQRRSERYLVMPDWAKPKISRWVYMERGIRNRKRKEKYYFPFLLLGIRLPGCGVRYEVLHNTPLFWLPTSKRNKTSILFEPGGWYKNEVLVSGAISTILDTKESKELFQLFKAELLDGFVKIQSFWLGPEAQKLLDQGVRLTVDVESTITLKR